MPSNYRVRSARAANAINADPQRMESADGSRWATGRNVKRALPDRRFDAVQVWALKTRDENGKAITVQSGVSLEAAREWCF